ncbi:hypothetical protein PR048_001586 [Dryococelus australis]|uniref:Integrase catalytic domain-containing protein n=1 Tax=Dryococelus australis TaxID=614101 RepID=A0ABQ9IK76_9NEOP|nr:hypothetical protein PR048_001586 [Dryococelus australis]
MEVALKRKYYTITRQVINAYLNFCEPCTLKKMTKGKGVVTPMVTSELSSRCQVYLIDMQSEPDGDYKFILNYQDHLTKFVVLGPLKTKTAAEVADVILIYFVCLELQTPFIDTMGVIEALVSKWNGIKIVHGKLRHSQSQGSIERANQDVLDSLVAWMKDNNTSCWFTGLRIVQSSKNRSYHSGIKRTPYKALFGVPQKNGLLDSCLPYDIAGNIGTEEQLEEYLSNLTQNFD